MIKLSVEVKRPGSTTERGEVVFTLTRDGHKCEIPAGIRATKIEVRNTFRPLIIHGLKVLYCIIEDFTNTRGTFPLDEVATAFRRQETTLHSYDHRILTAGADFAIDSSIASVGRYFRSDFKTHSPHQTGDPDNILDYIWQRYLILKSQRHTGTVNSYRSLHNSLAAYLGDSSPRLDRIDANFITGYDRYLKSRGIEPATHAFYMRTLKTLLNQANAEGRCQMMGSWFADISTAVGPVGAKAAQKAIDPAHLRKVATLSLDVTSFLSLARDIFMFSFYCKGLELADIANLRPENVTDGYLTFRKRRRGIEQRIRLLPKARRILDRYRTPGAQYIFPLLENRGSDYFSTVRANVAGALREIGKMLGIHLTFSASRYSWLTLTEQANPAENLFE